MNGRDCIEYIVEREREEAFGEVEELSFERYADALLAEAALPKRRPEWVEWAREQSKAWRALDKRLQSLIESKAPSE